MNLTDEVRREISADITKCGLHTDRTGSSALYDELIAKYSVIDTDFAKGLPVNGKVGTIGTEFDYRPELKALAEKLKMWLKVSPVQNTVKTVPQLLSEDIVRCQQYLSNPENEELGRDLYMEITGRYDSIINGFGQGLYSYFSEHHFYDPDISIDTVNHNLKLLVQKMISYQSTHYSALGPQKVKPQNVMNNKVFIVHGHDTAAKSEMARALEKAGYEAIILHEQASAGKTVIEKIEANTDVAFAIVLYTPCDMGRAKEKTIDDEKYRARQNVIFEHGYLIGRLGRKCVCALVKGDIETPGDISGVVYIKMDDAGAWKIELAKEMKNAGLSVDMNKFLL